MPPFQGGDHGFESRPGYVLRGQYENRPLKSINSHYKKATDPNALSVQSAALLRTVDSWIVEGDNNRDGRCRGTRLTAVHRPHTALRADGAIG